MGAAADSTTAPRARSAISSASWTQIREWLADGCWALPTVYLGAAFLITNLYWQGTEQLETDRKSTRLNSSH